MESVSGSKAAGEQEEPGLVVSGHMIQAVFSMIWSTVVMELWKRRSSSLSYRWGTMNLAERFAEPRPGFHGELGVNPVTRRVEPLFSEWQRDLRMALVSVPVVGLFLGEADQRLLSADTNCLFSSISFPFLKFFSLFLFFSFLNFPCFFFSFSFFSPCSHTLMTHAAPAGLVVLGMTCFYWGEARAQQLHKDWDSLLSKVLLYVPSVLHIVYTNMLGTVYKTVAQSLTEYGERGGGDGC